MSILILTGPPAAGKNTIGQEIVSLLPKLALIDVDQVRWMLRKPHIAPWLGGDGAAQARLGVENACLLAEQFGRYGCVVVVLDFLWDFSIPIYRARLRSERMLIARLMPSKAACIQRNRERGQWLSDGDVDHLYESMAGLEGCDVTIDNSELDAAAVAKRLVTLMGSG